MKHHTARQPGARSKGRKPDSPRAHRRQPASPPSSPPRRRIQKAGHEYFWTKEEDRLLAKAMKPGSAPRAASWPDGWGARWWRLRTGAATSSDGCSRPRGPGNARKSATWALRTDPEVARLIGRHPALVAEHRRRLGIRRSQAAPGVDTGRGSAAGNHVGSSRREKDRASALRPSAIAAASWELPAIHQPGAFTPEEDRLLGTMSDPETARRLHRSLASVTERRLRLKRPAFVPCIPWTPREDALLGKLPDQEVGRRLDRGLAGVIRRRRILGIQLEEWPAPSARSGIARKWTAAEKQLVGTMPDVKLARRLGRRYQSVFRMRQPPWTARDSAPPPSGLEGVGEPTVGRSAGQGGGAAHRPLTGGCRAPPAGQGPGPA